MVEDANEDKLGKALPDSVIRQLDQHLDLLGPSGRFGSMGAADLAEMHRTIYRILRDTGRRPGEVVSLKVGCIEVIDGQQNLIGPPGRLRAGVGVRSMAGNLTITCRTAPCRYVLSAPGG